MRKIPRLLLLGGCAIAILAFPIEAGAEHGTRPHLKMRAFGHSPNPASFNPEIAPPEINSDLAFWGNLAIHGNYDGFRIIDISRARSPREIVHQRCNGNQGDVVVFRNIVVRSWNSPAPAGATCDDQPVAQGFEGLHVFDISNLADPVLVASVDLECGSHTETGVPDLANNRLLIYNNSSSTNCPGFEIVSIPLDAPQNPSVVGFATAGRSCHDTGVILGNEMLAGCAGGNGFTLFSIGGARGGSLTAPMLLYTMVVPGVTIGHSAAFSFDGEVLVFGHEPGGGAGANCEQNDPDTDRSMWFYQVDTGLLLGRWVLPRAQSAQENCTIHNYNVVPLPHGREVVVSGNYQAGSWVTEFTNPASPVTLGWSDPPPLVPTQLGGDWSTYWYNGFLYESDITRGLNIFRYTGAELDNAPRLTHLNPQTQEFTIG